MKKFFAIMLSVVMLFSMGTLAFAEGESGSITVYNTKADATYVAYKVFDLQIVTPISGTEDAYFYTISGTSAWYPAVAAYAADNLTALTLEEFDGGYMVRKGSDFDPADFATHLKNKLAEMEAAHELDDTVDVPAGETMTATGATASIDHIGLGYYFVTSSLGVVTALTTATPNAEIYEKNPFDFEKVEDETTFDVGETVHYAVKATIPNTAGAANYILEFTDTMTEGLTYQRDLKVYIVDDASAVIADPKVAPDTDDELAPTETIDEATVTNYEITDVTDQGFKLTVNVRNENIQAQKGKTLLLVYSAVINENAVAVVSENSITMKYGNDPDVTEVTDTVELYSSKIVVNKVNKDTNAALEGATFVLYKQTGETKEYYQVAANGNVTWTENADDATPFETTKKVGEVDATIEFKGLKDGTYFLKETAAPNGYALLKDPVEVTLNGITKIERTGTADTITADDLAKLVETKTIKNAMASPLLPSTGGIGTTIFYCVGTVLVLAAVILLIVKKRMSGVEVEA